MMCPLKHLEYHTADYEQATAFMDCLKEECAWWVEASQSCAMEAIPRIIGFVGSELKTIAKELTLIRPK